MKETVSQNDMMQEWSRVLGLTSSDLAATAQKLHEQKARMEHDSEQYETTLDIVVGPEDEKDAPFDIADVLARARKLVAPPPAVGPAAPPPDDVRVVLRAAPAPPVSAPRDPVPPAPPPLLDPTVLSGRV
jgi:hypothetical protein